MPVSSRSQLTSVSPTMKQSQSAGLSDNDNPIISERELVEILRVVQCHALHNDQHALTEKINSNFSGVLTAETSSAYTQMTIFSCYLDKLCRLGPLPYISHYKFLYTLHLGITGLVRHNSQMFQEMPTIDLIKLISGVRCLLGKALLMEEKFVVLDIESFIVQCFPTLPVTDNNIKAWKDLGEVLQFDVKHQRRLQNPTLKIVSAVNEISAEHLKRKLINLSQERARSKSDIESSFMKIWTNIEGKFFFFKEQVESSLKDNLLQTLTEHQNVKLQRLTRGLSKNPSEDELSALVDHLQNVFIESQFWTSDLVQKKLAGY